MSYLEWLNKLIALGPKLPALLIIVQAIVAKVQEALALISGKQLSFSAPPVKVTAEIQAKENEVIALCDQPGLEFTGAQDNFGAIGDGTLLRNLWAFIQAHPELMSLILSLFLKK